MKKNIISLILFFVSAFLYSENLMIFKSNNKFGILDEDTLNIAVPAEYKNIELADDVYVLQKDVNNFAVFYKNKKIFETSKKIQLISSTIIAIQENRDAFSLFNLKLNRKICEVSDFVSTDGNIIPVCYVDDTDKIFHFIDFEGKEKFSYKLKRVYKVGEKYFVGILPNFDYAVFDNEGKILSTYDETSQHIMNDMIYGNSKDNKTGYFDINGKLIFKADIDRYDGYLNATNFNDGLALVNASFKDNLWYAINKNGEVQFKVSAFMCDTYKNSFSKITYKDSKNITYNYIDLNGKKLSPKNFEYATDFNKIYANVIIDGKSGLIDKSGKITWIFMKEKD